MLKVSWEQVFAALNTSVDGLFYFYLSFLGKAKPFDKKESSAPTKKGRGQERFQMRKNYQPKIFPQNLTFDVKFP